LKNRKLKQNAQTEKYNLTFLYKYTFILKYLISKNIYQTLNRRFLSGPYLALTELLEPRGLSKGRDHPLQIKSFKSDPLKTFNKLSPYLILS
jgi:hypothetical protein